MGILDDLKKQAESLKAQEQARQEHEGRLQAFYRTEILPKLTALYSYLHELTGHLNYVKPEIVATYSLQAGGRLDGLRQANYEMSVDSQLNMTRLDLTFSCLGEGNSEVRIEGKKNIERYIEYLRASGLPFRIKKNTGEHGGLLDAVFTIEKQVPIRFAFAANVEQSAIDLTIRNFEFLGVRKLQLVPAAVTDHYLERLGRYLVREDPDFTKLDISDNERERIRAQLKAESEARIRELNRAEQNERAASVDSGPRKLIDAFKRLRRRDSKG